MLLTLFLIGIDWTMLCAQEPFVEETDAPALSLGRLSVGLSVNYYFVPWNDLNDSFNAVRDAYAYNATLGLTSGTVDRHRGDLSPSLDLSYRVAGPISAIIEGGMTFSTVKLQLRASPTDHTFYMTPWTPTAYHNSFDLRVNSFGAGFALDLRGALQGRLTVTAGSARASLDYEFTQDNSSEYVRFNAALKDRSTYLTIGLESVVPIAGPLSFSLGAEYRSLRFADLTGDGSMDHEWKNDPTSPFTAPFRSRLVKAGSYYGIDIDGDPRAENSAYYLVAPWRAAPDTPLYSVPYFTTPATLYLTGLSIRGGFTYAF